MKPKTIEYKEIPLFADRVDRTKRSVVRLSRLQWYLFSKAITDRHTKPLPWFLAWLDLARYAGSNIIALLVARNVLLLPHFYPPGGAIGQDISINKHSSFVDITFNPAAGPNDL